MKDAIASVIAFEVYNNRIKESCANKLRYK